MKRFLLLFLFAFSSLFSQNCPFCSETVLKKQALFENERAVVLYCLTPAIHGNILILPKRHIEYFSDLTNEEMLDIKDAIDIFASAFPDLYDTKEFVLIQKNGRKAGQTVDHIHFHMIPSPVNFFEIVDKAFHYRPPLTSEEMDGLVSEARQYLENFASKQDDR